MAEKQFLTNPLAKWRHLEPKWKNFLHNFSPFLTQAKCKRNFEKKFIKTKVTADWKLVAILNFRRHFESDKKLFFYDLCGIRPLTKIKRENMKFFNIVWVMVKKLNFGGHFEQSRHFKTKQNSTFLKTGGYSPYIEVVFCKVWRKSKMYIFRYMRVCKTRFLQKLFQFYIHSGGGGQRINSISVLNDKTENFTIEKHV
jgi:hypothetical protein